VFDDSTIAAPNFLGTRNLELDISELAKWIDWSPFFHTWELSGRYPAILDDPKKGDAARKVFADGKALLAKIIDGKLLQARATYGFFRANSVDEQVVVFDPGTHAETARFPLPRQLEDKEVCYSLADFIAPLGQANDYLGAFIVTAGIGTDAIAAAYEKDHDDYTAIMAKALADRLAEAAAEWLHHRVRTSTGATHRRSSCRRRSCSPRPIAASARRSAIPPAPPTSPRARCSRCSTTRRTTR
jgi:5-methyltetrahydrofolate--homocysteine methyltransferase